MEKEARRILRMTSFLNQVDRRRAISLIASLALSSNALGQLSRQPTTKLLALVIGNSAYKENLPGPEADAVDISRALTDFGFEVTNSERLVNLDRNNMFSAIEDFSKKVGPNTIAILYYSGHGIEDNDKNFLVPTDASLKNYGDLDSQLVPLSGIIDRLERREARTKIIILDACRTMPPGLRYKDMAEKSGLAAITQLRPGTRLVYSASPNRPSLAAPAGQRNSVFTHALLKALKERRVDFDDTIKRAAQLTEESTKQRQTPWSAGTIYLSLGLGNQLPGNPLSQENLSIVPSATPAQQLIAPCNEISEQIVENGISTWMKKCI